MDTYKLDLTEREMGIIVEALDLLIIERRRDIEIFKAQPVPQFEKYQLYLGEKIVLLSESSNVQDLRGKLNSMIPKLSV